MFYLFTHREALFTSIEEHLYVEYFHLSRLNIKRKHTVIVTKWGDGFGIIRSVR